MGGVNKWIGIGHLGREAVLKYTPSGHAVTTVNVACSETWTDKAGQRQERTEWVRVVVWGKSAEALAPYLTKGKQIYVEGKVQTREWTDRDGQKKYTTEIRSDRIVLLGSGSGERSDPPADRGEDAPTRAPVATTTPADYDDSDIPW